MATKKDIAFDHFMRRAENPVKKRKAPAKRKPKTAAEKYITKKSQITGKTPTERLKKRREKNTETGYFPNPSSFGGSYESSDIKLSDIERLKYFVQEKTASGWLSLAAFHELDDAKEFATLISESGNVPIRVAT